MKELIKNTLIIYSAIFLIMLVWYLIISFVAFDLMYADFQYIWPVTRVLLVIGFIFWILETNYQNNNSWK